MAENLNLALDFREASASDSSGKPRPAVARAYIDLACSYVKEVGAPTITADCASFAEFETEIQRLKAECDSLLEDAKQRFAGALRSGKARSSPSGPDSQISRSRAAPSRATVSIEARLRVADVMTRDVKTMGRNQKLATADELMKVGRFRHVVVVDEQSGEIAGIISQRDIFYGALAWSIGHGQVAHQRVLDSMAAKEVMSSDVTTVAPSTPLAEAARIMLEGKIGCLPVVERDSIVGILTEGDFLAILTDARYGEDDDTPAA